MQTVQDEVETIHLYVVRECEKKPYTLLPLLGALLCLLGIAATTFYSAQHPYYEHQWLSVPAELLPPKTFRAEAPIIPTGAHRRTHLLGHDSAWHSDNHQRLGYLTDLTSGLNLY